MSQTTPTPTFHDVVAAIPFRCSIDIGSNEYERPERIATDEYRTWEAEIDSGWSYITGTNYPRERYVKEQTTAMVKWHRLAFAYCMEHPREMIEVVSDRRHWTVKRRGEYVSFCLPHQDFGGDRTWVSRDGKTKVLVDID